MSLSPTKSLLACVSFYSHTQITTLNVTFLDMSKRTLRSLVSLPLLQSLTLHYITCQDSERTGGDEDKSKGLTKIIINLIHTCQQDYCYHYTETDIIKVHVSHSLYKEIRMLSLTSWSH